MARLAHVPVLADTEPLQTFVSRLVAANAAPSIRDFLRHMNFRQDHHLLHPRTLDGLSAITGIDTETLASRNLHVRGTIVKYGDREFNGWHLNLSNPRFCPRCVESEIRSGYGRWEARPHVRWEWLLSFNEICVKHSTPIFTSSFRYPNSDRFDFAMYLRKNKAEVEHAIATCSAASLHAYDLYFAESLAAGSAPSMEFLHGLSYPTAQRLCILAGRTERLANLPDLRFAGRVSVSRDLRLSGFELLADRRKLRECLSKLNEDFTRRNKFSKGYALYGELQGFLTEHVEVPAVRPLIDFVRDCAMSEVPIGPEDPFIGGGGTRRWHTAHTAMRETGIDSRTLRRILEQHGVLSPADRRKSDNYVMCRVSHVEAAVAEYHDDIDIEAIARRMGLTLPTVQKMIKAGLLTQKPKLLKKQKPKFSRKSVDELMEKLTGGLEARDESADLLQLGVVAHKAVCSIVDILGAILQGRVSTRYLSKDPSRAGVDRLLVDVEQTKAAFAPPSLGVKCHEFLRELGLTYAVGKPLFYSGLFELKKVTQSLNGVPYCVVEHEAFAAFRREYITLSEASAGWMPHRNLKVALESAGILPVRAIGQRRNGTLYRRSEIESYRAETRKS